MMQKVFFCPHHVPCADVAPCSAPGVPAAAAAVATEALKNRKEMS